MFLVRCETDLDVEVEYCNGRGSMLGYHDACKYERSCYPLVRYESWSEYVSMRAELVGNLKDLVVGDAMDPDERVVKCALNEGDLSIGMKFAWFEIIFEEFMRFVKCSPTACYDGEERPAKDEEVCIMWAHSTTGSLINMLDSIVRTTAAVSKRWLLGPDVDTGIRPTPEQCAVMFEFMTARLGVLLGLAVERFVLDFYGMMGEFEGRNFVYITPDEPISEKEEREPWFERMPYDLETHRDTTNDDDDAEARRKMRGTFKRMPVWLASELCVGFAMALHPRLGQDSVWQGLTPDLVKAVLVFKPRGSKGPLIPGVV